MTLLIMRILMHITKIEMRIWRTVNKSHLMTVLKFLSYTSKLIKTCKYRSRILIILV